jgi:hypothetical protein
MFRDVEEIIRKQIKVSLFLLVKKKECNSIFGVFPSINFSCLFSVDASTSKCATIPCYCLSY